MNPEVLRMKEAALFLGVSRSTLYNLIGEGKLPEPKKIGKRIALMRVDALREFLNTMEPVKNDSFRT
jgi:excisionase family DNA binding protein